MPIKLNWYLIACCQTLASGNSLSLQFIFFLFLKLPWASIYIVQWKENVFTASVMQWLYLHTYILYSLVRVNSARNHQILTSKPGQYGSRCECGLLTSIPILTMKWSNNTSLLVVLHAKPKLVYCPTASSGWWRGHLRTKDCLDSSSWSWALSKVNPFYV